MRTILSCLALAMTSACASTGGLPGAIAGAPDAILASRSLVTGSLCMLIALVERCGDGDAPVVQIRDVPIAPMPAVAYTPDGAEGYTTIRVLTWNVEGLPPPLSFDRADALKDIGDSLAAMRAEGTAPHVVLIQEGFLSGAMRSLIRRSGYRYVARGPGTYDRAPAHGGEMGDAWVLRGEGVGKLMGAGLYVLSDFPILEAQAQPYAHCAGVDCLSNKGAMLARIVIPGSPDAVTFLNTHLNSRNSTHTPRARAHLAHRNQIDALERFVQTHAPAGEALIFGGDFNMGDSPQRWAHAVPSEPFAFARSWCDRPAAACDLALLPASYDDPRLTQDQQGFHDGSRVRIQPQRIATLHQAGTADALSDHSAYLVEYRVSWSLAAPDADIDAPAFARLFVSSEIPDAEFAQR